jgi:hypothetical protein
LVFFFFFSLNFINIDLADYGESRLLVGDKKGTVSKEIGTYIYMAPELLNDEKKYI